MRKVKIITADEAAKLVKNGDTITTSVRCKCYS